VQAASRPLQLVDQRPHHLRSRLIRVYGDPNPPRIDPGRPAYPGWVVAAMGHLLRHAHTLAELAGAAALAG
jgi:hypothetical protein